ncbi:basic blue protein-like [Cornus florida]|uniref:basic blue protein-like n=1 Tax=Cornus florida TaxID=4283 RepID=UPI00289955FD|nr:basic blue protein-like [Cornus florida]XP_059653417.1 basic blue protein-like [Cornus florida]XP_059653418.1 basic blue protein-like [Cornus florida]XP_059653419.1 basic blue protein-like [Cornus florida]XP_059653420.1 basic blue protein-like [Cornus florida]XP_059653421.1 basic blue protein-like [Cornus florida]XP_059653422.1 basic blue protein-like [Cornus florida]
MSQGRGSAILAATMVLCLILVHHCVLSQAATHTVGGASGWSFNVVGWPKGKHFMAGDTLVFNYNPALHNVVVVDKAGFSSCKAPGGAKVYNTGKDRVKLVKGQNFFICSFPGHCGPGNMKIAINAM